MSSNIGKYRLILVPCVVALRRALGRISAVGNASDQRKGVALAGVAGLAYAPFAQRTLIRNIYRS